MTKVNKKIIIVHVVMMTLFYIAVARLFFLVNYDKISPAVSSEQSTYTINVTNSRGTIYDTSMLPLTNAEYEYVAIVPPTAQGVTFINTNFSGNAKVDALKRLESKMPIKLAMDKYVYDPYVNMYKTPERYLKTQTASNIVGYIDGDNSGVSGIEYAYNDILTLDNQITESFKKDATGTVISSNSVVNDENYSIKQGVMLTIDIPLQRKCEQLLQHNIQHGSIVVIEAATGKIKAASSNPGLDPLNIELDIKDKRNNPMINRAFSAYNIGSVFKLNVAAAALESGYNPYNSYKCLGYIHKGGHDFHCEQAHGETNMYKAIEQSCNTYFVNLTTKLDIDKLYTFTQSAGFGKSQKIAENFYTDSGTLPSLETLKTQDAALANFSFGQGEVTGTPLQVATFITAIINGGEYYSPYLVQATVDQNGILYPTKTQPPSIIMSEYTSNVLKSAMISVVEEGTGTKAMPKTGGAGGKTGSAETGLTDENGEPITQTWFAGFNSTVNPQYAIVIMSEFGKSGADTCAPLFAEVCNFINESGIN